MGGVVTIGTDIEVHFECGVASVRAKDIGEVELAGARCVADVGVGVVESVGVMPGVIAADGVELAIERWQFSSVFGSIGGVGTTFIECEVEGYDRIAVEASG